MASLKSQWLPRLAALGNPGSKRNSRRMPSILKGEGVMLKTKMLWVTLRPASQFCLGSIR